MPMCLGGSPLPRIVVGAQRFVPPQAPMGVFLSPFHVAARSETPSGISPVVAMRQSAISSFLASATIIVLRVAPRASAVRARYHCASALSLLEDEEAPGELDHAAPHPRVTRLGETLLPSPPAALVRRAGEAGIAGDRLAVPQAARQDLAHEHVRSLDADPDDPRDEANHRRRTFLRGSRRELAQALLLDVLDLLAHHAQPHHIAAQLRARVLGQRRPFRGAKTVEPFLGLAQRRLKGADPEARQHCLHPGREARPVADELFVLAARPFGVFVRDRRNRRHAAVALLAPQPAGEGAQQQLRVETIGLCPSVLARDSDARGMDDIGLDAAPPQPARQPKAVASGLIGDDDALDLPTRLCRFVAPTLHKLQQLVLIGRKLLQRLALDAWDQPRDEPIRLAHFDDGDQRAILIEGGKGSAQIVRLRHGALHRIARQRRRWHALAARPIPSSMRRSTAGPWRTASCLSEATPGPRACCNGAAW